LLSSRELPGPESPSGRASPGTSAAFGLPSRPLALPWRWPRVSLTRRLCYNPRMTLLEITYELQSPLSLDQLSRLGEFANTYGLRRFRVDEQRNHLTFEYDGSRLRETQVAHVLGQAGIAVTRKIN
jgi:hypothetical protein